MTVRVSLTEKKNIKVRKFCIFTQKVYKNKQHKEERTSKEVKKRCHNFHQREEKFFHFKIKCGKHLMHGKKKYIYVIHIEENVNRWKLSLGRGKKIESFSFPHSFSLQLTFLFLNFLGFSVCMQKISK